MRDLTELEQRLDLLRERDRLAASLHGKQRMMQTFEKLFDEPAREEVDTRIKAVLDDVRDQARTVAIELARHALRELGVDDLVRLNAQLGELTAWLDAEPSERLSACQDLLTFVKDLRAVEGRGPLPSEL